MITFINNKFSAKKLEKYSVFDPLKIPETYEEFEYSGLGKLLLNKKEIKEKWKLLTQRGGHFQPKIKTELPFPPILIPSSGRPRTALLDLSSALPGVKKYVQIVIVRESEAEDYLGTIQNYPMIDVFIMKDSIPPTVGAARSTAKKLAENLIIGLGSKSKFAFLMDDNVLSWQGVTLINDPHPQFDVEPSDEKSQRSDISLLDVLTYCSHQNIKTHHLHNFSIIGFSMGAHKSMNKMKLAFERQHVFAAVFLNIARLKNIEYDKLAWAREDIDFNQRTNDHGGLIVKCRRFLAKKMFLDHGGIVPEDPSLNCLRDNPIWRKKSYVKSWQKMPQPQGCRSNHSITEQNIRSPEPAENYLDEGDDLPRIQTIFKEEIDSPSEASNDSEKDARIKELEKALEDKDKELQEKDKELQDKDKELQDYKKWISGLQGSLNDLTNRNQINSEKQLSEVSSERVQAAESSSTFFNFPEVAAGPSVELEPSTSQPHTARPPAGRKRTHCESSQPSSPRSEKPRAERGKKAKR